MKKTGKFWNFVGLLGCLILLVAIIPAIPAMCKGILSFFSDSDSNKKRLDKPRLEQRMIEVHPMEILTIETYGQFFNYYPQGPIEFSLNGDYGQDNEAYLINFPPLEEKEKRWIRDDPGGQEFPWKWQSVNEVSFRIPEGVQESTKLKVKSWVVPTQNH